MEETRDAIIPILAGGGEDEETEEVVLPCCSSHKVLIGSYARIEYRQRAAQMLII